MQNFFSHFEREIFFCEFIFSKANILLQKKLQSQAGIDMKFTIKNVFDEECKKLETEMLVEKKPSTDTKIKVAQLSKTLSRKRAT